MKELSNTEKRVLGMLKAMKKALPEIKRQVAVYEKSLISGKQKENPKIKVHSKNV